MVGTPRTVEEQTVAINEACRKAARRHTVTPVYVVTEINDLNTSIVAIFSTESLANQFLYNSKGDNKCSYAVTKYNVHNSLDSKEQEDLQILKFWALAKLTEKEKHALSALGVD